VGQGETTGKEKKNVREVEQGSLQASQQIKEREEATRAEN